ncbi:MAG: MazG family protein, partial [Microvirga sp.]
DAGRLPVEDVNRLWDRIKQDEREERRAARMEAGIVAEEPGFLGGIAEALPALARAQKLTARAAKVGFDWPETGQVVAKIHEELEEVREAAAAADPDRLEDEVGDLLFAVTNLARHHGIDPEKALRRTNAKFERRFKAIEDGLARAGSNLDAASLDEMERLWVEAKAQDGADIKR